MSPSIEHRHADGLRVSERFENRSAYVQAVRQLWARHVECGHVIESDHGRVQVRDPHGAWVATYWLVH